MRHLFFWMHYRQAQGYAFARAVMYNSTPRGDATPNGVHLQRPSSERSACPPKTGRRSLTCARALFHASNKDSKRNLVSAVLSGVSRSQRVAGHACTACHCFPPKLGRAYCFVVGTKYAPLLQPMAWYEATVNTRLCSMVCVTCGTGL